MAAWQFGPPWIGAGTTLATVGPTFATVAQHSPAVGHYALL